MSYTDKYIVETYSGLFEGLSSKTKIELIDNLSKSLKTEVKARDDDFYKSFGAFGTDKSAEEIVADITFTR